MNGNTFNRYFYSTSTIANYPNNTYAPPGTPDVVLNKNIVRANRYESGRAHITVFNWALNPTVSVDISNVQLYNLGTKIGKGPLLQIGDSYEVRDAENFFKGPVVSGVYNGNPLTIPMTGLTTAQSNYAVQMVHTAPKFGAFILLKTAGGVDTTPPTQSNGQPSGTISGVSSTTMSLQTSEAATCKYATTANVPYNSMINTFSTTGGLSHSTLVSGLTNGNTYTYYIKCRDSVGNINTNDYTLSFSVASVVTYSLTVSKTGTGSGIVSSNPAGITCGSTCSANYTSGTLVTLTLSSSSGSTFFGWSGACSGTGNCVVTMDAVKNV